MLPGSPVVHFLAFLGFEFPGRTVLDGKGPRFLKGATSCYCAADEPEGLNPQHH